MGNFFSALRPNTLCLCSTLIAFSITTMPRIQAFEPIQMEVGLNDIAFGIKVEKLIEKIKKYKDKLDEKKMLATMVELKTEIEGYTGKKINIDKALDRVESDMKKEGAKFEKDEFKTIRKTIKKAENRSNHKAMYMADCLAYNLDYDREFEHLSYQAKHSNNKEDKNETNIPLRVTVGVTIALCGIFLMFVPFPICQANGPWIAQAGLALAIDGTLTRAEENDKKK